MTRRYWKIGALALSCMALGAGASVIANAGAATSTGSAPGKHAHAHGGGFGKRLLKKAVEGSVVLAVKGKFVTVTFARGTVHSVSGQQLTIDEGTKKATYRTVTLTIPQTARVRINKNVSTLSAVHSGQRVTVIQAPQDTWVLARG